MLRARKHRKVFTTKVSNQKPEAEFCQHPTAPRVAIQVPYEPKHLLSRRIWKPKQKFPVEASGIATPKLRLSREEKGKMPVYSNNAADHKVKTTIIPSPNSRAAMPCVSLAFTSEATVPRRTHWVYGCEARAKVLSKANPLRSSTGGRTPQRAPPSSSSSTRLAPVGETRAEVLFSTNTFCRDKKNGASSHARSKKASPQGCSGSVGPDLREFLANKRKLESLRTTSPCCQQSGCQLVTVHSAQCRLRPILATPPCRQSVFDRLSVRVPIKHHKRSISRDPASASVNMTGRGREPRRGSRTSDDTPCNSQDSDYSPGLGEVLVREEGVFRNTRSRVAIPYNYEQSSSSMTMTLPQPRR